MRLEDKLRENNIPTRNVEGYTVGVVEGGIFYRHPLRPNQLGFLETGNTPRTISEYSSFVKAARDWRTKHAWIGSALMLAPIAVGAYLGVDVEKEVTTINLNPIFYGFLAGAVATTAEVMYCWFHHYPKKYGTNGFSHQFERGVQKKKKIFGLVEQFNPNNPS